MRKLQLCISCRSCILKINGVDQKKELVVLTDQLIERVQLPELKSSLYEIKTNILTK